MQCHIIYCKLMYYNNLRHFEGHSSKTRYYIPTYLLSSFARRSKIPQAGEEHRRRIVLGVVAKCATAILRSVWIGGWSPFRDVYDCVVAKWLCARATKTVREEPHSPLRSAHRVEDPMFVRFTRDPSLGSTKASWRPRT